MMPRRYSFSKLFVLKEVSPGVTLLVPQTEDLSNSELQEHFDRALEKEDFEYCQAISAEAQSRNVALQYQ